MTILHAAAAVCALIAAAPTAPAVPAANDAVLLDFTATWCAPCRQMEPVVARLASQGYPVRKVDIDREPALAQQYRVTGVPCFVLVVGGREAGRVVGATNYESLAGLFGAAQQNVQNVAQATPKTLPTHLAPALGTKPLPLQTDTTAQAGIAPELITYLLRTTVRIQIDDGDGHSWGTGTIVDAREGEALVLTCGHLFRDSKGKGRVTIDLHGAGAPQDVPARVVGYDLESDIGFLTFRPGVEVAAARIAPPGYSVRPHDAVVNIGCSRGADATARVSRVTTIDKFLGPPNLQVKGQPVQGRSGGGLFSAEGYVIGVCNAADPEDDEGLYAALAAIHAELNQAGLAKFCLPIEAVASAPPPTFPTRMPALGHADAAATTVPTSSTTPAAARPAAPTTETIQLGGDAEVVCIIRSKDDPEGKSRVVTLDEASPEFLQQLIEAQRRNAAPVGPRERRCVRH
jgi:thiol-disulfide isomerase/thioredoxin